ncbi:MAG TPA: alpha-amylase family glycosyl hydrolase [Gemmataceae bacterium]|nr:alpha-amylase family glycosyl hydrolase [Gemmataceae bacterium]
MADPTSVAEIDLAPLPGKIYFNCMREWREEFIYFVMVDRFHDDKARTPVTRADRSPGFPTPNDFYGGKIRGITRNLDYIAALGCTAIWLSPVFENNAGAYHGYNINNYLGVDPNFGTKQDLIDLVEAAHARTPPIRIILDVVINHSGDNWSYPGGFAYNYSDDQQFPFGFWRRPDRPLPSELRNEDYYHRRGNMSNYDTYPENQHGDMDGLKDYDNDDDADGSALLNVLIKAHCYWIREADVDGFRVDAVKHMGELACSRFSSGVREYAYSLGKRRFFLFGELANPQDDVYDRYLGPNTSKQNGGDTVFFGIDSLLDFRLAAGVYNQIPQFRQIIRGVVGPQPLFDRLEAQRNRALNRGEIGRYLVTFVDNHDGFWQDGRFAFKATDGQVIAAIGYLLCALGTACIYYGTEQGLAGHGGDNDIREALFDRAPAGKNLLNASCVIYTEIAKIAALALSKEPLRFGRMYFRQISGNGTDFGLPYGTTYTLAFSRMLYGSETLVAYNVSSEGRNDCVVVDADLHKPGEKMTFLYPAGKGEVTVESVPNGTMFVRLDLDGHEFAILE